MSIFSQLISGKITWAQAAEEVAAWGAKELGLQPGTVQAEIDTAKEDIKQVASTALGLADTALGPILTTGVTAAEGVVNAAIIAATGGAGAALTPAVDGTITTIAAALKGAIDAEVATLRGSLTAPPATMTPPSGS